MAQSKKKLNLYIPQQNILKIIINLEKIIKAMKQPDT